MRETENDLGACTREPPGYALLLDEVALDGATTRLVTIARDGRNPLTAVARDDGFVVVDRACDGGVLGALAVVHITDDGVSRGVPIPTVADGVARAPLVPAGGGIGALLSRRSTASGRELSIERFDVETGASIGVRQAWSSDAILADRTVLAVDREGNTFWPVTLFDDAGGVSDWLVSFLADGSAPMALHLMDRGAFDGGTRLRWWDGRLFVDTRTDVGFALIEVMCGD